MVEDSDGLSASALESLEVSVWIVGVCGGDLRVLGALIEAMSCPDSVELVVGVGEGVGALSRKPGVWKGGSETGILKE